MVVLEERRIMSAPEESPDENQVVSAIGIDPKKLRRDSNADAQALARHVADA